MEAHSFCLSKTSPRSLSRTASGTGIPFYYPTWYVQSWYALALSLVSYSWKRHTKRRNSEEIPDLNAESGYCHNFHDVHHLGATTRRRPDGRLFHCWMREIFHLISLQNHLQYSSRLDLMIALRLMHRFLLRGKSKPLHQLHSLPR